MSIKRRWVAQCDHPACDATEVLDGDQYDDKDGTTWTDEKHHQ